jgi:hypothetical protein
MDNQNLENSDGNTFNIFYYIKENLSGLFLLLLAFFIIYFVDYINRVNAFIYSTSSQVPLAVSSSQKISKRKFKKR